jgi:hypothetical protein
LVVLKRLEGLIVGGSSLTFLSIDTGASGTSGYLTFSTCFRLKVDVACFGSTGFVTATGIILGAELFGAGGDITANDLGTFLFIFTSLKCTTRALSDFFLGT